MTLSPAILNAIHAIHGIKDFKITQQEIDDCYHSARRVTANLYGVSDGMDEIDAVQLIAASMLVSAMPIEVWVTMAATIAVKHFGNVPPTRDDYLELLGVAFRQSTIDKET